MDKKVGCYSLCEELGYFNQKKPFIKGFPIYKRLCILFVRPVRLEYLLVNRSQNPLHKLIEGIFLGFAFLNGLVDFQRSI